MTKLIQLTRLYTKKGSKATKRQKFFLNAASIESIRPSTQMSGQKATVVTQSGMVVPVAETVVQVNSARNSAMGIR